MKNTIRDPEVISKIHEHISVLDANTIPTREFALARVIDHMDANGGLLIGRLPTYCKPNPSRRIKALSNREALQSTVDTALQMLPDTHLHSLSIRQHDLLCEYTKDVFKVTDALLANEDKLICDPRLVYEGIKDKLNWADIAVTQPEYIFDRYIMPILRKEECNVKLFARD